LKEIYFSGDNNNFTEPITEDCSIDGLQYCWQSARIAPFIVGKYNH
jgi:hypothetical protein